MKTCPYPDCKCPIDMGEENVCGQGLPIAATVRVSLDPRNPWPFVRSKVTKPKKEKIDHSKFTALF